MSSTTTATLATDLVLVTDADLIDCRVLLVRRGWAPHADCWALPGGLVDTGETTAQAAHRELAEETHLEVAHLRQVGVYDTPDRDPRGRVVSVAHATVLDSAPTPAAGDDATAATWVRVADLTPGSLAFDHHQIVRDALTILRRARTPHVNLSHGTVGIQAPNVVSHNTVIQHH